VKYIVVLGDGMADLPKGPLGRSTPLMLANMPVISSLAKNGQTGLIKTIDKGLKPGSDVANLSVLGYDPKIYYSGRSALEALSIGVNVNEHDAVLRMNFVTLSDGDTLESRKMLDHSAGEISTEEARELVNALKQRFTDGRIEFFTGTGYRHCAVMRNNVVATEFSAPHDFLDQSVKGHLPTGSGAEYFTNMIEKSLMILASHPINVERQKKGLRPANAIWFWGKSTKPNLPSFYEKYGLKGAVISAVDLLKGIAIAAKMTVVSVEGATGNLHTNFTGKANACVEALKTHDYVYLHVEAPDECSHQGDAQGKILAIERIDYMVYQILKQLDTRGEQYVIAVLPDHATPLYLRTHTDDLVPYVVFNSVRPAHSGLAYNEADAQKGLYLDNGRALLQLMLTC